MCLGLGHGGIDSCTVHISAFKSIYLLFENAALFLRPHESVTKREFSENALQKHAGHSFLCRRKKDLRDFEPRKTSKQEKKDINHLLVAFVTHVSEMRPCKNSCPEQDSNSRLPALLVSRDIYYTIGSPHWSCGNFIDVSRSNAANPRGIFPSRHLCVSWLFGTRIFLSFRRHVSKATGK